MLRSYCYQRPRDPLDILAPTRRALRSDPGKERGRRHARNTVHLSKALRGNTGLRPLVTVWGCHAYCDTFLRRPFLVEETTTHLDQQSPG